jgi:uroporphyrinogen-III synthase
MRVLLLRPHDEAARAARSLAARGHEATIAPVLTIARREEPLPAGPFDVVLATSAQAFGDLQGPGSDALRTCEVFCVGARTALAARAAGFARVAEPAANAVELAVALIHMAPAPARLLYLAARDRKPDLERILAAAGYEIIPHVVYAAEAASCLPPALARALSAGEIDAALHYSRRSAALFSDLAMRAGLGEDARRLRHVTISADAAQGLRALAPPDLRIAATADEAGLLDALD